jgi:hypothetical protein
MFKIQRTVFLIIFLASMLLAASTQAADNTCRIVGSAQDDVWVIIYDADADGNRGPIIWKGKIEAGKEIPITSTDGHIRYNRASDPNQPYDGDESRACYGNNIIQAD